MKRIFETGLEKIGRIIAAQYDIEVVFQGSGAKTDGKTIYLPATTELTPELMEDMHGFLDHEVGHCRYSCFNQFDKLIRGRGAAFHKNLLNALEDVRIEREIVKEFPGCHYNLKPLNEKLKKGIRDNGVEKYPWPVQLIFEIEGRMSGEPWNIEDKNVMVMMDRIETHVAKLNDCKSTDELRRVTEDITRAVIDYVDNEEEDCSGDCKDRKNEHGKGGESGESGEGGEGSEKEEGSEGTSKGKGGEEEEAEGSGSKGKGGSGTGEKNKTEKSDDTMTGGGSGSEEEKGAGEGEEKTEASGSEGKTGSEGEGDEGGADKDGKGDGTGSDDRGPRPPRDKRGDEVINDNKDKRWDETNFTVDDMIRRNIEKFCEEHPTGVEPDGVDAGMARPGDGPASLKRGRHGAAPIVDRGRSSKPYLVSTTRFDKEMDVTGKGDPRKYNKLKAEINKHVSSIKHWLEKTLKVQENVHWRTERERGMINGRSLNRMFTNPNYRTPFKEQRRTETTNVAVEILIDLSGSMSGDKIETARLTAIAIAEALTQLQIPFEITGFHSVPDQRMARWSLDHGGDLSRFARYQERLELMVFKRFDSAKLNGLVNIKSGYQNPDGDAVKWAANRLSEQKQKRKIMLVLSDGHPATSERRYQILHGDLYRAVRKIIKAGIEVVGIGIMDHHVREFYPEYVVINNIAELPRKVMGKLARIIARAG